MPHRMLKPGVVAALALVVASCVDDSTIPSQPDPVTGDRVASVADSWPERVAQGMAVALADRELRIQVLEDLRDSPFESHQIPLVHYLTGADGRPLATAAAAALDMSVDRFLDGVRTLPGYALRVPVTLHRMRWTGDANIAVIGTAKARSEWFGLETLPGYVATGRAIPIPTERPVSRTLLVIAPSNTDFGDTPEMTRTAAPRQSRATIGTAAPPPPQSVRGGRVQRPGGEGIRPLATDADRKHEWLGLGCTREFMTGTTAAVDYDHDGLNDNCEGILMEAFRPVLTFHADEPCNTTETHWTVHETSNGWIVVAYLLSYHEDCGLGDHAGDSEFLIAWMSEWGGEWQMDYLTTSAHAGTLLDETDLNHWSDLSYDPNGLPYVYVSNKKHANYRSLSRCGDHPTDDCDGVGTGDWHRVIWFSTNNIGTKQYRFNLDTSIGGARDCTRSYMYAAGRTGVECYFSQDYFAGWSPFGEFDLDGTAGSYAVVLDAAGIADATVSYGGGGGDDGGDDGGTGCPPPQIICDD